MAYYEFFDFLDEKGAFVAKSDGAARNVWSERRDGITINVTLSANTNDKGWAGTAPHSARVRISRPVRTPGDVNNNIGDPIIPAGELLFYRLAQLSTKTSWTLVRNQQGNWPKVYLELDNLAGLRLKFTLERLVIDGWSLDVIATNGAIESLTEELALRAWVINLEHSAGNPLRVALGDTP